MDAAKNDKTIETVAISDLKPYDRNARTHSREQVETIAKSIREFGFTNPILIDEDGLILAGHGRVLAAKHLQMQYVPCLRLAHLTETQKRAYVIADNQTALRADWDDDLLRSEIAKLRIDEYDVSILGFDQDALIKLMFDSDTAEFISADHEQEYLIIIECESESEQRQLYDEFTQRGLNMRVLA